MIEKIRVHEGTDSIPLKFETPPECPVCHTTLDPTIFHKIVTTSEDGKSATLSLLSFCRRCRSSFLSTYTVIKDEATYREHRYFDANLIQSVPFTPVPQAFSDNISRVSPRFVDIYNQAYQAEQLHLTDISGMGYRKSLEFLVKDYLIFKSPDSKDAVEKLGLSQCVDKLHDINPSLKAIAKCATWLGNDEAHYIRLHMDYDTDDLKRFIDAMVTLINLLFITEEAASIESKK